MERSADPAQMAAAVRSMTTIPVTVADDARRAVLDTVAAAGRRDTILVTGSLYFLGEIRPALAALAAERGETPVLSPASRY